MVLQQRLRLPFNDDISYNVQIRIESNGKEYKASIQASEGMWHRLPISLREHDVEELNSDLQDTINQVSDEVEAGSNDMYEMRNFFIKLAKKGKYAFNKIFPVGISRETISNAINGAKTIQISSEEFFLPWELLYDGLVDKQTNFSAFWGLKYIISRALIQDARPGDFISPIIRSNRPKVGLVADNGLKYVKDNEIPTLYSFHDKGDICIYRLRPLDATIHDDEMEIFSQFLQKDNDIIHLACHASIVSPLSKSYLRIADDFDVTFEDFDLYELVIQQNPFVILNACLTGMINPLRTSNWASLFWAHGARGVLATEFDIPDWFAANFIGRLYENILLGKTIGESLRDTRNYFWFEENNPLGLAYALYSSPSIKILKQLGDK